MLIHRPYLKFKKHINEGDILLFRGKGIISKLVGASSETPYSHVGLASWVNGNSNTNEGILECVEFREGSLLSGLCGMSGSGGGQSVNLHQEVKKHPGIIDVYRPDPIFFSYDFDEIGESFILSQKEFDGKKVSVIMRRMTGLPYGWKRIWWMFKHRFITFKIFGDYNSLITDRLDDVVYPVCSTAIAYAFNSNGYDLVNNRSDQWTEPGDIAKSTRITYIGTLVP